MKKIINKNQTILASVLLSICFTYVSCKKDKVDLSDAESNMSSYSYLNRGWEVTKVVSRPSNGQEVILYSDSSNKTNLVEKISFRKEYIYLNGENYKYEVNTSDGYNYISYDIFNIKHKLIISQSGEDLLVLKSTENDPTSSLEINTFFYFKPIAK